MSVTPMSIRNLFYSFKDGGTQTSVLPLFIGNKPVKT